MKKLSKKEQQAIKGGGGGEYDLVSLCPIIFDFCKKDPANAICNQIIACVHFYGLNNS